MKLSTSFILLATALMMENSGCFAQKNSPAPDLDAVVQKANQKTRFLRLVTDRSGQPESLQTAITRYRSEDGKLLIDLIAVVHVGEADYYRKLNRQMEQYASLLYELVAAPGQQIPQSNGDGQNGNPIRMLQNGMQTVLGLESQLKHINYRRDNFVHADLSPRKLQEKMAERGETMWSLGLKAIAEMLERTTAESRRLSQSGMADEMLDVESLFQTLADPSKLKIMMARQFTEGDLESGLGQSLNQLLITDRNSAAIQVLRDELAGGKTRLGIFYGAAHMPDFERRLVSDFGLRKTDQVWADAWNLKSKPNRTVSGLPNLLSELVESFD